MNTDHLSSPGKRGICALAVTLLVACVAIGTAACRGADPATEASAASLPGAPPPNRNGQVQLVRLNVAQLRQIRIELPSNSAIADAIKATGTIEFNADRMAKLLPPVSGQVQDLKINVGDTVRRNDVVFVLSSRDVAAAIADHQSSRKDLELAEKTYAMNEDLFEHQVASRMALDQSESDLAKARSKVMQTEESLRVLGLDPDAAESATRVPPRIPVRTPIAGTVIERTITGGQFVGPDAPPVMTIADLSTVWVQGDIFERDLRYVAVGQKADVITTAYPADRFTAQVSRVASVVDAQTRTAKVRFLVANPGSRLKPGMFAAISLYVSAPISALTVPTTAVFVENGVTFAYVQVGPQEFARREVETAARGSDRLRVLRGVQAGDRIVSDGVLLLRQLESAAGQ